MPQHCLGAKNRKAMASTEHEEHQHFSSANVLVQHNSGKTKLLPINKFVTLTIKPLSAGILMKNDAYTLSLKNIKNIY